MNLIVFDSDGRFSSFESALLEAGIRFKLTTNPEDCLRAYVKAPETDAILIFGHELILVKKLLSQLKLVNPLYGCVLILNERGQLDELRSVMPHDRYDVATIDEPLAGVVKKILGLKSHEGERRSEHRVGWRLKASLYAHDPLDQKISNSSRLVEVISLSANGAYISSSRAEVEKDSTWLFEINLPDCIFLVKGRVVWINLENDIPGRPRGFALRFEEMSQAPQQMLKLMIETDLVESVLRQVG